MILLIKTEYDTDDGEFLTRTYPIRNLSVDVANMYRGKMHIFESVWVSDHDSDDGFNIHGNLTMPDVKIFHVKFNGRRFVREHCATKVLVSGLVRFT